MIESWGRGIERIVAACATAGLAAPTFRYEATGLWTMFEFTTGYTEAGRRIGKTTQETTQETTQGKILTLLKTQPSITRRELAARLAISADGVKYHLQKMSAAKIIKHVGPTKTGHWEVLK